MTQPATDKRATHKRAINNRAARKTAIASLFGLALCTSGAMADMSEGFDLRGGAYLDGDDPLVGIGYEMPIGPRLSIVPNAEYVFVDPGDMYTVNVDSKYSLNPSAANPMWVGAGLGLIHRSYFNDSNDAAFNLLWGIDFDSYGDTMTPFISTKAAFSDDSEFAVNFGVKFGGRSNATQASRQARNP
ncbi:MAG: hypothetical protein KDI19_09075 [Pseudomonadales bacterium]|nr:hypothetical protein [Pseudomonadales bacterium]